MKQIMTAGALALALTACGDSAEDTLAAFCESQDELVASVEAARELSVSSSLDEVEAARDAVESAWDDYEEDAQELEDVAVEAAGDAYDQYVAAVDQIPGEDTLAEAYVSVAEAAEAYFAEVRAISDAVECP